MPSRTNSVLFALGVLVLSGEGGAAAAQDAQLAGPVVPGVCLISQEAVFANAKVGQAATARLRQLAQAPAASLNVERQAIEADAKTLDGQKASLPAAQFRERQQALVERGQAYQAKEQSLAHQIDATRQKAINQIAQAAQPIVAQAYQQHGCGLLFSRETLLAGNMANDLTATVVQGLDAKMTTLTFDLEPPPPPSGAPAQ
ncbi:MAG: OmpH family outer membrane protein [Caulobacteraceae bacterium]|nr:OmpH family outer membrane protein [Caulobacteraceae bacterium]